MVDDQDLWSPHLLFPSFCHLYGIKEVVANLECLVWNWCQILRIDMPINLQYGMGGKK